jgi:hypothetical protein
MGFAFMIAGFLALWFGMAFLAAFTSGWMRLARRYRSAPAAGVRRYPQAFIGFWPYRGPRVVATDAGLSLAAPPLTPGHPPLLIPWTEMSRVSSKKGLLGTRVSFSVDGVRVRLSFWFTPTEILRRLPQRSDAV